MKPLPIRLRLTLWYCAMFATATALLSTASWWMLRRSVAATEYHEMQERADDVQQLLTRLDPGADLALMRQTFRDIYQFREDGKYLQVVSQDNEWIYRSKRMVD